MSDLPNRKKIQNKLKITWKHSQKLSGAFLPETLLYHSTSALNLTTFIFRHNILRQEESSNHYINIFLRWFANSDWVNWEFFEKKNRSNYSFEHVQCTFDNTRQKLLLEVRKKIKFVESVRKSFFGWKYFPGHLEIIFERSNQFIFC